MYTGSTKASDFSFDTATGLEQTIQTNIVEAVRGTFFAGKFFAG
jgi:hypothetical protein